jgi:hypothetical protein
MDGSDTVTRDAFLDVVWQDEELLRAEFDAIISASWPEPPEPPPPPAPPAPRNRPPTWPAPPGRPVLRARPAELPVPPGPWRGRQRSPPEWKEGDAIDVRRIVEHRIAWPDTNFAVLSRPPAQRRSPFGGDHLADVGASVAVTGAPPRFCAILTTSPGMAIVVCVDRSARIAALVPHQ